MLGDDLPRRISVDLSSNDALDFVERLTEDDAFRRELEQNPQEVLARYGVEVTPEMIPSDLRLPDKEHLRELRSEIAAGRFRIGFEPDQLFYPFFIFLSFYPFLQGKQGS